MSAGRIDGYAVLWSDVAADPDGRGADERIARGALTVSAAAYLDAHHFAASAAAFTKDKTLTVGEDETGIYFTANLPATAAGFDIANGLCQSKWGALAVSLSFTATDVTRDGHVETVTKGIINAVSILRPGTAAYGSSRAWLAGTTPAEPVARDLAAKFAARSTSPTTVRAMARPTKSGVEANIGDLEALRRQVAEMDAEAERRAERAQPFLQRFGFAASSRSRPRITFKGIA